MASGVRLARLREERAACLRDRDEKFQAVKRASMAVGRALESTGLSSQQIAQRVGYSDSQIRQLVSDGDARGWQPRSLKLCKAIDDFVRERALTAPELAPLRAVPRLPPRPGPPYSHVAAPLIIRGFRTPVPIDGLQLVAADKVGSSPSS